MSTALQTTNGLIQTNDNVLVKSTEPIVREYPEYDIWIRYSNGNRNGYDGFTLNVSRAFSSTWLLDYADSAVFYTTADTPTWDNITAAEYRYRNLTAGSSNNLASYWNIGGLYFPRETDSALSSWGQFCYHIPQSSYADGETINVFVSGVSGKHDISHDYTTLRRCDIDILKYNVPMSVSSDEFFPKPTNPFQLPFNHTKIITIKDAQFGFRALEQTDQSAMIESISNTYFGDHCFGLDYTYPSGFRGYGTNISSVSSCSGYDPCFHSWAGQYQTTASRIDSAYDCKQNFSGYAPNCKGCSMNRFVAKNSNYVFDHLEDCYLALYLNSTDATARESTCTIYCDDGITNCYINNEYVDGVTSYQATHVRPFTGA